jgi:hypothetical protein
MNPNDPTRPPDAGEPLVQFAEDLRCVFDLERSVDPYGRDIYVEEWQDKTRRPKIWYQYNRQGHLIKYHRRPTAIITSNLGRTRYLQP